MIMLWHGLTLGRMLNREATKTFTVDALLSTIRLTRPDSSHRPLSGHEQKVNTLVEVVRDYFDGKRLEELLSDLESTKRELEQVRKLREVMGDPVS
jgi:hypothetical protein